MSDAPLRVGLIGYGLAGAVFHAPLIGATAGLRLQAVVTADPDRRHRAVERYPGVQVHDRAEGLWRQADDLDLVVVAAPNRAHVPLARAAVQAGLPVVVDKPLAATADEARSLMEFAHERGVPLTVFQNRRWDADIRTVRGLLDDGALGRVVRLESRYERWRPTVGSGWRERSDPAEAGGLLYDLGSHLIDQALHLFGPVVDVYAEVDRSRQAAAIDDDVFVALHHRDGVRSHLWMSSVAAEPGPRLRLLGDQGAYVSWGLDGQEAALRDGAVPGDPGWGEVPAERWGHLTSDAGRRAVPSQPGAYQDFYAGVAAMVRDGSPPPVDPLDAVQALAVIGAAQRSAAERSVVAVPAAG